MTHISQNYALLYTVKTIEESKTKIKELEKMVPTHGPEILTTIKTYETLIRTFEDTLDVYLKNKSVIVSKSLS